MSDRLRDRRRVLPFFQVVKADVTALAERCEKRSDLPYARSVYMALLEIANDHRQEEGIRLTMSELSDRSGVSRAKLYQCVGILRTAGLVEVASGRDAGDANEWALLSAEGVSDEDRGVSTSETGGVSDRDTPIETVKKKEEKEQESASPEAQQALLPAPRDEVWAHYRRRVPNGDRYQLTPARRRMIDKALKVRTIEECCRAIDGLFASDYHVKNGYTDIKYALGGRATDEPDAVIDRWLAQVPKTAPVRQDPLVELLGHMDERSRPAMRRLIGYAAQARTPESRQRYLDEIAARAAIRPLLDSQSRIVGWERISGDLAA